MTSIARSLQPNLAGHIPTISPSEWNNISTSYRSDTKEQNKSVATKSKDTLQNITHDDNSASLEITKMMGAKFKTMSSSPTIPLNETSSDLFPSSSSHLIGHVTQCEAVSRNAQYLGSFPVQAADQGDRAEFVRKQLVSMKEVTPKRPVLMVISLAGIKVTCPQGQTVYSSHALRRISYATCEPSNRLMAFLAREPHSPLYLQHCHVFRTNTAEQSEDLNTLIGNAFRVAYAIQIQSDMDEQQPLSYLPEGGAISNSPSCQHNPPDQTLEQDCYVISSSQNQSEFLGSGASHTNNNNRMSNKTLFTQSRSVESLLSSNQQNNHFKQNEFYSEDDTGKNVDDGCYANIDELRYLNNTNDVLNSSGILNKNGNFDRIERIQEEPFYETADFVRDARERMSDNTFSRKAVKQFNHSDRNYPGRFSQRNCVAPKKNIRYPPPNEKAPAIPLSSDMHHSKTMHSLATKLENSKSVNDQISNNLMHQLTLHQNRYQHHGVMHHQQAVNESISQKLASAITQGKKNFNSNQSESSMNSRPLNAYINSQTANKKNRPDKPNSLPVLNCLFAALNKQNKQNDNEDDHTPYCEVPDATFSQLVSHPLSDKFTVANIGNTYNNTIFTQNGRNLQINSDDFNQQILPSALCDINSQTSTPPSQPSTNTSGFVSGAPTSGSGSGGSGMSGSAAYYINESMSESSGDSLNNSNNGNNNVARTLHQMRNGIHEAGRLNGIGMKGNQMKSSKSAHVITSCEVYAEVADAAESLYAPEGTSVNQKRQSYHSGGATLGGNAAVSNISRLKKPLNLSIDELRHVNGNGSTELISPSSKDKNKLYVNGGGNSSGFNSAGDGSTCSNGTTPPPLGRSTPNVSSTNGLHQGSTVATISNMNFESLNDSDILEEPELQSAPWFQSGMPRDLALEVLKREPEGSFLVRESNSRSGRLALSVRVPFHFHSTGIAHYLIVRAPKGFRIKGCPKQFSTMTSLIVHHSVMAEMLPCTLSLNRYNPTFRANEDSKDSDGDQDSEDEGDYLDPSKDSDYELISKLRCGLMKENNIDDEEDDYSELQNFEYESIANKKSQIKSIPTNATKQTVVSKATNNISKDDISSRANTANTGRHQLR